MGCPPTFSTRAPDDVIAALTKTGFKSVRLERPEPTTPWNVIVATLSRLRLRHPQAR